MKKILLTILVGALCLVVVMIWIGLAWIICLFLSVYVYEPAALYWFILSLVGLSYLFKLIVGINIFKGIVKLWNNIGKYLDLND
jgi:hypothetical protein